MTENVFNLLQTGFSTFSFTLLGYFISTTHHFFSKSDINTLHRILSSLPALDFTWEIFFFKKNLFCDFYIKTCFPSDSKEVVYVNDVCTAQT